MEYSFLADLLTTFRSSSDIVKIVIVGGFYVSSSVCFVAFLRWLLLRRAAPSSAPVALLGSPMRLPWHTREQTSEKHRPQ